MLVWLPVPSESSFGQEHVFVWVPEEADVEMKPEVQWVCLWVVPVNGSVGGGRAGRESPGLWCRLDKDSPNLGLRSASCPLEQRHFGWKWPGSALPVLSHWPQSIPKERGFSLNAQVALEGAAAGGCQQLALEWGISKAQQHIPSLNTFFTLKKEDTENHKNSWQDHSIQTPALRDLSEF